MKITFKTLLRISSLFRRNNLLFLPNPESIRDGIGNLSCTKGLRTSRNDRDGTDDVVLLIASIVILITLILIPSLSGAAEQIVAKSKADISFKQEVENAIGRGLAWLASKQTPEDWWSQQEHPALTGLVLTAFQGDPSGFYKRKYEQTVRKGYGQLLNSVKPDGGIYGKDLANYNTSVCMMALLGRQQV